MARSFNSNSDQIVTSYNPLTANVPFSVSIWIILGSTGYGTMYSFIAAAGAYTFALFQSGLTGKLAIYSNGGAILDPGTTVMTAGIWNHVAVSYDGASHWRPFVNGVLQGTPTATPSVVASTFVSLGKAASGGTGWNGGSSADAAFWSAQLTDTEILALAKGARPNFIRPQALGSWLPLDGYGHPALDRTIRNNNGTLTGTSLVVGPPLLNAAPIMLTTVNSGEAFLKRSPLMVAAALPKTKAAVASSVVFRKTLSQIGGRVGTRQIQGWAN